MWNTVYKSAVIVIYSNELTCNCYLLQNFTPILAIKSKTLSQKLTEYGLLKLHFGNNNLQFIYLGPTSKAIVISSPQALKLIFETIL